MAPKARTVFWRIVGISIGIRVFLQVLGMVSVAVHGQDVWARAIDMWSHWDAPHYVRIAEVGYVPEHPIPAECLGPDKPVHPCDDHLFIVFFPFFPGTVRVVAFALRNLIVSGLVVSLLASIGAAWFGYRIVERDRGHEQAWRTVLLLLSFPTAYYLAAPYSEALFLFAVVAAMYLSRTGTWIGAGVAGALATGTRVTGLALFPALLFEAFTGRTTRAERIRRLGAIAIAGGGLAVYLLINQVVHGDPLHFLNVQRAHWYQHLVPPWQPLVDAIRAIAEGSTDGDGAFIYWGRLAGFAFAVTVLAVGVKRLHLTDTVYAWTGLLLIMSASWLISLPRYLLVLYPLFMVGADLIRSRRAMTIAIAAGSAIQVWLFWRYAVGLWTF
jgi:hypothetical protein